MTDPNIPLSNPDTNVDPDAVPASEPIENVAPGITCQWLYDRRIVVFTLGTVARTSIDLLLDRVKTIMTEWPADRPYLAVYEVADSKNGPTPYIRERFRKIPEWRPDIEPHIALIVARNFQGLLVQLFGKSRGASRAFFSREDGIAWLKEFLDSPSGQK